MIWVQVGKTIKGNQTKPYGLKYAQIGVQKVRLLKQLLSGGRQDIQLIRWGYVIRRPFSLLRDYRKLLLEIGSK